MNEYKQQIIDFYDGRDDYDNDFTYNRALSLFELVPIKDGQTVLDVATGTGFIALKAAKKIGDKGKVIAVDFSDQMLQRCQKKIDQNGFTNIELKKSDVNSLNFKDNTFDAIFCSSAIVLFPNIIEVLKSWHNWLKLNGYVAFSVYSQESFFTPTIMKVCDRLGYDLPNIHNLFGTEEKCQNIIENLGFRQFELEKKQFGEYLTLDDARKWWKGNWLHPIYHPLLKLNESERKKLIDLFAQEVSKLATSKGVWYESMIFLITAQK